VKRRRRTVGDVVQVPLPDGTFAYGRVLEDAAVAFYAQRSTDPEQPPIGSRKYEFVVGVYYGSLRNWAVVGRDPGRDDDENWPPPAFIEDSISGGFQTYYKGVITPSTAEECQGLERAAVWSDEQVVDRLMGDQKWTR
jgi:hypothetical protein